MSPVIPPDGSSYTALDIISEALENIGAKGPDETLSDVSANSLLRSLNFMMDTLSGDKLMFFTQLQEDFALVAGQGVYTIGLDGDFDTDRPESVDVESSFIRVDGVDYPLLPMTEEEYNAIPIKSVTGSNAIPTHLFYKPDFPVGQIKFWPVPSSGTLYLVSLSPFNSFPDITTEFAFPAGYLEMLSSNFSVRISPKYNASVDPVIGTIARESISKLQARNAKAIKRAGMGVPVGGNNSFNFYSGR